jgi:Arc/MetJ-type ribon-helix-helix transcriptional regulator
MYHRWGTGMSETEKITINLGLVDLGQIDLLVQEGFYSNRTDFIRTAIRNQLRTHAEEVRQTVERGRLWYSGCRTTPALTWRRYARPARHWR